MREEEREKGDPRDRDKARNGERQEMGRERDRASQSFWGCPATKTGITGGHHTHPAFTWMLGYPDSGCLPRPLKLFPSATKAHDL